MFPRILVPTILIASASALLAADKSPAFTEPEAAGPDFAIQGEYTAENGAAQVLAMGNGKFHIVGWSHGLPGAAPDAEKTLEIDAERDSAGVVRFSTPEWNGEITGDTLRGTNAEGKTVTAKKTLRTSTTLGQKPPAGAVVLFDGSNADAWQNGKMDERGLLGVGTKSKQTFGDCTLHVEFRTPFMPEARGQGRGNSGVYVQDRYECQVLDSFSLKGQSNETGGIYQVAGPKVNTCLPPLSWQTYDIDLQSARFDSEGRKTENARISVRLNGTLVQDNVELRGPTPGGGLKESADPGPIMLQNHGNPVFFRNIWVLEKKK